MLRYFLITLGVVAILGALAFGSLALDVHQMIVMKRFDAENPPQLAIPIMSPEAMKESKERSIQNAVQKRNRWIAGTAVTGVLGVFFLGWGLLSSPKLKGEEIAQESAPEEGDNSTG